jgi:hypothetical protein
MIDRSGEKSSLFVFYRQIQVKGESQIEMIAKKNNHPINVPKCEPVEIQKNNTKCPLNPENKACGYYGTGFLCYSADGSCLKDWEKSAKKGKNN